MKLPAFQFERNDNGPVFDSPAFMNTDTYELFLCTVTLENIRILYRKYSGFFEL